MHNLAIVIPAFKDKYFNATLKSLDAQTNKDFCVYIGDDNSPNDLKSICDNFTDSMNISYTRFPNNIGSENLVNQWSRCVELTKGEDWIWLFSDDDLVDKNCVENFYKKMILDAGAYDIYRFNTIIIDADDKLLLTTPVGPDYESSEEMAYNLLLGKRGNSMADHIFSRKVYKMSGGFVFTKYAQGADWAMSILFSKRTGIAIIQDARFYWRYSGNNISSTTHSLKRQALKGHLQFLKWVLLHFDYLKDHHSSISYKMINDAAVVNFIDVISYHYNGFNNSYTFHLARFMQNELHLSKYRTYKILLKIKKDTYLRKTSLFKFVKKMITGFKPKKT